MNNLITAIRRHKYFGLVIPFSTIVIIAISVIAPIYFYYESHFYPNTYIAGVNLSNLGKTAAYKVLSAPINTPSNITLKYNDQDFNISTSEIEFSYDIVKSVDDVYNTQHNSLVKASVILTNQLFNKVNNQLSYNYNTDKLNNFLSVFAGQVTTDPIPPSAKIVNGSAVVTNGKRGTEMNKQDIIEKINKSFSSNNFSQIVISLTLIDPSLNDAQLNTYKSSVETLVGKSLLLTFEDQEFKYKDSQLVELLNPQGGTNNEEVNKLVSDIKPKIERDPQNPTFVFADNKVREFLPSKDGIKIDDQKFTDQIISSFKDFGDGKTNTTTISIPTINTPPTITTDQVNNLGINELIGRGKSQFKGSIASRIHNIGVASSKLNGVLVSPGETFSFNSALGDVSSFTGYKQAYIIKDGKTILGDGGGVCQVSTTLFRAALAAGLPISERHAHSYRVGYYEQDSGPGIDATVYSPTTDLKFINNTPGHILIQSKMDDKNLILTFEIYGTSDGRVATTTRPVVTNATPPPDDQYVDDPTLPMGQIKQIEYKAWGAKASFDYKVIRNNETIYQKTFVSNYRPWQAVYLRGIGQVN